MVFTVTPSVYEQMLLAAEVEAPLEACGLLGGTGGHACHCFRLTNADASAEHYSMLPEEQFAAIKEMRQLGLSMLAIWHSHPESPARMSEEDMRLALTPGVVYLILSLADPAHPDLKGFRVTDGRPQQIEVATAPEAEGNGP